MIGCDGFLGLAFLHGAAACVGVDGLAFATTGTEVRSGLIVGVSCTLGCDKAFCTSWLCRGMLNAGLGATDESFRFLVPVCALLSVVRI